MQSASKARKNVRLSRTVLKVVALLVLLGFITWQLMAQDWSKMNAFHLKNPVYLICALILVVANQGCEWFKWKRVARSLTSDPKLIRNAFFSGIGTGFVTPNGWGNFMGRMVYFRKRDRLYIVFSSFISNVSQVLPTVFFGAVACLYSDRLNIGIGGSVLLIGTVILLAFFFGEHLIPERKTRNRTLRKLQWMKRRMRGLRLPLFLWSNLRFIIFSAQYVLLFMAFGYTDYWFLTIHVWLIFLLTSFVPSLWSGKLLIRETAAIFAFKGSMVAIPDVVLVSLLIWVLNIILPAIVSSFVWIPVSKNKQQAHVVD